MSVYKQGNNWYIDFTFHGQRIREMKRKVGLEED